MSVRLNFVPSHTAEMTVAATGSIEAAIPAFMGPTSPTPQR